MKTEAIGWIVLYLLSLIGLLLTTQVSGFVAWVGIVINVSMGGYALTSVERIRREFGE